MRAEAVLSRSDVDHFSGHAAVHDEVLAGDEGIFRAGEEEDEAGDVVRGPDPASTTLPPSSRNALATAFPIPWPPPVTIATLPCNALLED